MISDEMLMQASVKAAEIMNNELPRPSECNHSFSEGFEAKIKRLIFRSQHCTFYRALRIIASVLIALLLGVGSVLTVSVEARQAVFGWVRQQYESFYEYFFAGEIDVGSKSQFVPNWMPHGYQLLTCYDTAGGAVFIYTDGDEKLAQFSYTDAADCESTFIDGVEYEKDTVTVHGCQGELYIAKSEDETNSIVWTNASRTVLFTASGNFDSDTLLKIAENISKK